MVTGRDISGDYEMSVYKRLLVAVDLSAASSVVMQAAVELARVLGGEVRVIHVHKVRAGNLVEGGMEDAGALAAQEVAKLEAQLEQFAANYVADGIAMTLAVYSGEPSFEIVQAAAESGAGMIVMGTHGRTGLSHLVLGSVAENVLRQARIPVVCIKYPRS